MAGIHILDRAVAELIAAGEVVERPASVTKELIENSVDAGATRITVEIEEGGIRLIRVQDNGCGIAREDVPRAFVRHATSKVLTADDLDAILTLGFRGEALASIAAVSRTELLTCRDGDVEGSLCHAEGGDVMECEAAGRAVGTTVTVRDLFYNTPARMKFLKKNSTEGGAVAQVVEKTALSHPEIAFRFIRDGQVRLQTSGSGELLPVIAAVYGREIADGLIPVDYLSNEQISVRGYTSKPDCFKPGRTLQTFFVNHRFVRTRTAAAALEQAYKGLLMSGRYPVCVLDIGLNAASVDVNVHPAKTEVRFTNEKAVFHAVYHGVKTSLGKMEHTLSRSSGVESGIVSVPGQTEQGSPKPDRMTAQEFRVLFEEDRTQQNTFSEPVSFHASTFQPDIEVDDNNSSEWPDRRESDKKLLHDHDKISLLSEISAGKNDRNGTLITEQKAISSAQRQAVLSEFEEKTPKLRCELFETYLLLEDDDRIILVDKHAAHERILYDELLHNLEHGSRQILLTPAVVRLSGEDYELLRDAQEQFASLGFLVEDFGDCTVIVREVPLELNQEDLVFILEEAAEKLRQNRTDLTPGVMEDLYSSIACRAAVKAGDKNTAPELNRIIAILQEHPDRTHCPHGRPVFVEITNRQVKKMFGRLG